MNLKLPILFHTESTSHLEELEIDFQLSECDVRETVFYTINGISPYTEFGKDYTTIYSNGFDFICPMNAKEVERLIQENKDIFYAN